MSKTISLSLLDSIQIASPCPARWEDMQGDEASRFCGECRLNVYNIAAMTRNEAEALILAKEGHLCVRLFRRPDGTVLTADCPVGLRLIRQKTVLALSRVAASIALLLGSAFALGGTRGVAAGVRLRQMEPFATISEWISPSPLPVAVPMGGIAGRICIPAPPPTQNIAAPQPASMQN